MKRIIIATLLIVMALALGISAVGDNSEMDKIIELKKDGIEEFKKAENLSEDVVAVYELSHFVSKLDESRGDASLYDIVKSAEEDVTLKAYLTEDTTLVTGKKVLGDFKDLGSSVKIFGKEYTLLDVLYFAAEDGIYISVYLTDGGVFVNASSYGVYTWEEYVELYRYYLDYEKPLFTYYNYHLSYMKSVFPFTDFEEPGNAEGKTVILRETADITSLRSDNITAFKNGFSDSEKSIDGKNVVLTYGGLFDTEADLYKLITNAEKNGDIRYIVYSEEEAFKTDGAYKVSQKIFDRNYLLKAVEYFDAYPDTLKYDGKDISITEKVYFWEVQYGFVAFFITEEGVYASVYSPSKDSEVIFPIEKLTELKGFYEKHKKAYPVYHNSFCTYVSDYYLTLNEKYHKEIDSIIAREHIDGYEVNDKELKESFGYGENDVFVYSRYGSFMYLFAQEAEIGYILTPDAWQKYYVITENEEVHCITVNENDQSDDKKLSDSAGDRFMRIYSYVIEPSTLFGSDVKVSKVYFLEENGNKKMTVYFVTDKGDFVLHSPELDDEEKLYLMPVQEFCACAKAVDDFMLSLDPKGEGLNTGYTLYRDCKEYEIEGVGKEETLIPDVTPTPIPNETAGSSDEKTPEPTPEDTSVIPPITDSEPQSPVLWIAVGVVIAVIAVGCVYFFLGKKKN